MPRLFEDLPPGLMTELPGDTRNQLAARNREVGQVPGQPFLALAPAANSRLLLNSVSTPEQDRGAQERALLNRRDALVQPFQDTMRLLDRRDGMLALGDGRRSPLPTSEAVRSMDALGLESLDTQATQLEKEIQMRQDALARVRAQRSALLKSRVSGRK